MQISPILSIPLYYVQKFAPRTFEPKMVQTSARNTKVYKICEICRAIFPSLILQHFATKLCNFTNFTMLFLAASCSDGFRFSCLDQNLVYGFDHPREIFSALAKFCSLRFKLSKFEYFRFLVKAFHPYKPICLLRTC